MAFRSNSPDRTAPHEALSPAAISSYLSRGALVWLGYAILQLAVNGIVLDETVIFAQTIAGTSEYPAGHPHQIYYWRAFNLAHYLNALLWLLVPSAELLSAGRNVLFLFASTFSVFALTLVLVRQPRWAYAAAALVVIEANLPFTGVYPIFTFPNIYSNGHLGIAGAVLAVAFMLGGMWRLGALLVGIFPAVHGTVALLLWGWAGSYVLFSGVLRDRKTRNRLLIWFGAGVGVCAGLAGLIAVLTPTGPAVPPYDVTGDGAVIREQFRLLTDVHRSGIPFSRYAYLVNPIALFAVGGLLWFQLRTRGTAAGTEARRLAWVLWLGGLLWAYVFATASLEALGFSLPHFVQMSMPGRFSNLSVALLVSVTAAALAWVSDSLDRPSRALLAAVFAAGVFGVALLGSPLGGFERRFLARHVLVVVWGMVLGSAFWSSRDLRQRVVVVVALAALSASLVPFLAETRAAFYLPGVAAATVAGFAVASKLLDRGLRWVGTENLVRGTLLGAFVASALLAVPERRADRLDPQFLRWDMMSDDDRAIESWLRANAGRDEMVLAGFMPRSELQVKTEQPVLFELKTIWIMTYMPELAPLIGMMVKDLYGVDYSRPEGLRNLCRNRKVGIYCGIWDEIWAGRTREEWRALGERYGFRLVVNESRVPLDLEIAYRGERWSLYTLD